MVYKKKKGVDPQLSKFMGLAGKIGGASKSDAKIAACRKNAKKTTGRPEQWTFEKGTRGFLGVHNVHRVIIPDEVADNPDLYKDQYFRVRWKGKNVSVKLAGVEKDGIHVRRY